MKGVVYTSLVGFKYGNKKAKSYKDLNDVFVEWVETTTEKLIESRNKAELDAGRELKRVLPSIEKQVFFRIHGRCYFLDYYYSPKRVAIEIDGGYHKGRKEIDKQRDKDFAEIGIATIRISDKDVLNGKLLEKIENGATKIKLSKSRKKKAKKEQKRNSMIEAAMKRVKEHERMKHNANWI